MDAASPKMDSYWNNSPASQCSNYERLNFAASANDDGDYSFSSRRKIARDPMSHRIIEKRRRDRMNNCLADLSRLLPASFLKKGRGRIEKTEIIEMAIKHLKHLQAHACSQSETCEIAASLDGRAPPSDQYRLGFHDCISEMIHFLVEVEGFFAEDAFCGRLVSHLQKHFDRLSSVGEPYTCSEARSSSISSGSNSGMETKANGSSSTSSLEETPAGTSKSSSTSNSVYSSASRLEENTNHLAKQHNGYCDTQSREDNNSTSTRSSAKDSHSPDNHSSTQHDSDNCGSQLREMLLSANPDGYRKKPSVHSDDASGMYKFKTNIHQRFAAEHVYPTPSTSSNEFVEQMQGSFEHETKRRRLEEDLPNHSPHRNQESPIVSRNPPHHSAVTTPVQHEPSLNSIPSTGIIPIFALHPHGSFYIPMTLETSLIIPLLESPAEGAVQPVLHPVSISVNFCHPSRTISMKPYQNSTSVVTNHSSSTVARIDGPSDAWRMENPHGGFVEKRSSRTRRASTEEPPDRSIHLMSPTRETNPRRQLRTSRQNDYHQQGSSARWSYLMAANKRQTS